MTRVAHGDIKIAAIILPAPDTDRTDDKSAFTLSRSNYAVAELNTDFTA